MGHMRRLSLQSTGCDNHWDCNFTSFGLHNRQQFHPILSSTLDPRFGIHLLLNYFFFLHTLYLYFKSLWNMCCGIKNCMSLLNFRSFIAPCEYIPDLCSTRFRHRGNESVACVLYNGWHLHLVLSWFWELLLLGPWRALHVLNLDLVLLCFFSCFVII